MVEEVEGDGQCVDEHVREGVQTREVPTLLDVNPQQQQLLQHKVVVRVLDRSWRPHVMPGPDGGIESCETRGVPGTKLLVVGVIGERRRGRHIRTRLVDGLKDEHVTIVVTGA